MNSAVVLRTIGLLMLSNGFMLFPWYGHLKTLGAKPWYVAAIVSWSIALFEYLLQVPANRIGFTTLSLAQLKIVQEIVTLAAEEFHERAREGRGQAVAALVAEHDVE